VRFAPAGTGLQAGSLTATSSFGTSNASLSGSGVRAAAVDIPRSLIDFGSLLLSQPPATRSLTLRNTGNATLGINSVATTSPFTLANGCGVSVGAGDSCVLNVNFNPTVLGEFSGFLNLSTNAPGAAFLQIPLHAIVQARPEPLVRVTPRAIGFGNRLAATRSPTNRVTITNDGGAIADLQLSVTQPHFVIASTTCGPTLAPQSSCFADLAFQPVSFGAKLGDFMVTSNSPGSPITVNLAGAGCRPVTVTQGRGATPLNCSP
jgi:hypothetical protein